MSKKRQLEKRRCAYSECDKLFTPSRINQIYHCQKCKHARDYALKQKAATEQGVKIGEYLKQLEAVAKKKEKKPAAPRKEKPALDYMGWGIPTPPSLHPGFAMMRGIMAGYLGAGSALG